MARYATRIPVLLFLIACVGMVPVAATGVLTQPIMLDVAPLAKIWVQDSDHYVNLDVPITRAFPELVLDSLCHTEHGLSLPVVEGGSKLRIELPFELPIDTIAVLGSTEQTDAVLEIKTDRWAPVYKFAWVVRDGVPPLFKEKSLGPFRVLELEWIGPKSLVVNTVSLFVRVPRVAAWFSFFAWAILGPWLCAMVLVTALFGSGWLVLDRLAIASSDLGKVVTAGLTVMLLLAFGYLSLGGGFWPATATIALVFPLAVSGWSRFRRAKRDALVGDREVLLYLALLSFLLLSTSVAALYSVTFSRIGPLDYQFPWMGTVCFNAGVRPPVELRLRPWLLQLLFAPIDEACGPWSLYAYNGFMAGINSLIIPAFLPWIRSWSLRRPRFVLNLLVLMPLLLLYHHIGQRPFVAALSLFALFWWTRAEDHRISVGNLSWGGLAATLAIGAHPSALFLLPLAFAFFLITAPGLRGIKMSATALALPAAAYLGWQYTIGVLYPGERNHLLYYPLMLRLDASFPADWSFGEIWNSLTPEHWRQLAFHRLFHLRHYLVTDNLQTIWFETRQYISLPCALGGIFLLGLFLPRVWRRDLTILWLGCLGPLLIQHLHIGQANLQLHISALPFATLALLLAAAASELRSAWSALWLQFVYLEWFSWPATILVTAICRLAFVQEMARALLTSLSLEKAAAPLLHSLGFPGAPNFQSSLLDTFGCFGGDAVSKIAIALIPPAAWLFCLAILAARSRERE